MAVHPATRRALERVGGGPEPVTITITGAAGSIGYSLAFRIASGEMLGPTTPVRLRLLTTVRSLAATQAMALELEDCASHLLRRVTVFDDPGEAVHGANLVVMLASATPSPGSDRVGLLEANAKIIRAHARAVNQRAADDVRVVVVANPTTTATLIAAGAARDVPPGRFSGLSRLDHDRAVAVVAAHHGITADVISRLSIWGNHSETQVPDASQLLVDGCRDCVDLPWVDGPFPELAIGRGRTVRLKRGTAVASTANAIVRHVRDWVHGTAVNDWTSAAVVSDGSYDVPRGLVSSFPVVSDGTDWAIVRGLALPASTRRRIAASVVELRAERESAFAGLVSRHRS